MSGKASPLPSSDFPSPVSSPYGFRSPVFDRPPSRSGTPGHSWPAAGCGVVQLVSPHFRHLGELPIAYRTRSRCEGMESPSSDEKGSERVARVSRWVLSREYSQSGEGMLLSGASVYRGQRPASGEPISRLRSTLQWGRSSVFSEVIGQSSVDARSTTPDGVASMDCDDECVIPQIRPQSAVGFEASSRRHQSRGPRFKKVTHEVTHEDFMDLAREFFLGSPPLPKRLYFIMRKISPTLPPYGGFVNLDGDGYKALTLTHSWLPRWNLFQRSLRMRRDHLARQNLEANFAPQQLGRRTLRVMFPRTSPHSFVRLILKASRHDPFYRGP